VHAPTPVFGKLIVIRFTGVGKSFRGGRVLDDLSFTVQRREIVGILGPSGVGKTTILRLIAGLIEPDTGQVTVEGTRLGYVFQEPRLLPWRTVLENVRVALRASGMAHGDTFHTARCWLDKVGLADFERYYPVQLSGGMQQRVALARAFAIQPDILLLDEPFSNLDARRKTALLDILQTMLRETAITVVYVTHDLTELLRVADRVFNLHFDTGWQELDLSNRRSLLLEYISDLLPVDF
jgi:NitT/TauT family transport system ATP-binding protein